MKKKIFILVILSCFILLISPCINAVKYNNNIDIWNPIIKPYNSFIEISYDESELEQPINIDEVRHIHITISYSTDIPWIYSYIPFPINTLILYGQKSFPYQLIEMDLTNKPESVSLYIIPEFYTDIPFKSDGAINQTYTLSISPQIEALGKTYTINITASCNDIGRVKGTNKSIQITFSIADI